MLNAWTFGDYQTRFSITADVPTIVSVESACYPDPWSLERVESFLSVAYRDHERTGLVASHAAQPFGYALITIGSGVLAIERLGIQLDRRRKRVGTKIIALLILEGRSRNLE